MTKKTLTLTCKKLNLTANDSDMQSMRSFFVLLYSSAIAELTETLEKTDASLKRLVQSKIDAYTSLLSEVPEVVDEMSYNVIIYHVTNILASNEFDVTYKLEAK